VTLLAIDTATPATVIGLRRADGSVLEARDDPRPGERPGHSTRLLPLAAALLAESGLGWREVERIAVGVGPGTFTGLRVGVATAHGLAQSSGAELVGVSSLRALALALDSGSSVLAAIDARRGEVFVAGYQGEMVLISPRPVPPAVVPALLAAHGDAFLDGRCLAVGDGAVLYRSEFERSGVSVPDDGSALHRIRAAALCELGVAASTSDDPVLPDYLRRPDAAIAGSRAPVGAGQAGALQKAAS
jgi:tRNA threonylcarbamoyladenosine biosynthesis protein TsaB